MKIQVRTLAAGLVCSLLLASCGEAPQQGSSEITPTGTEQHVTTEVTVTAAIPTTEAAVPETSAPETTEAEVTTQETVRPDDSAFPGMVIRGYEDFAIVDEFADIDNTDKEQCHAMQGMTICGDYAYMVKVNGSNTQAIFFRVDMRTGEVVRMQENGGREFVDYIKHGNDICSAVIDGQLYLFVSHLTSGVDAVQVLRVEDTVFTHVAQLKATKSLYGLEIMEQTAEGLRFIATSAPSSDGVRSYTYYEGTLDLSSLELDSATADSLRQGEIKLDRLGKLDIRVFDGADYQELYAWASQGIGYRDGQIFVPITKGNTSVIAVYRVLDEKGQAIAEAKLAPSEELTFCLQSDAYTSFEAESVAFYGKDMYFNTNRVNNGVRLNDGLHRITEALP